MALQFIINTAGILLYEAGIFRELSYRLSKNADKKEEDFEQQKNDERAYNDIPKDSDVIAEEERISGLSPFSKNAEIFIVDKLTKYYSNFMAVKGISFSMKKGECFGLLGVNGAGKTSTFKMITGDEYITKGEAYINKTSLKANINKFQRQLGYCPQFDPLIDHMTVIETMQMYSALRGIKQSLIDTTCKSLIKLLDLGDHVEKMCYTLSGGNKRKLSVAIALIGSPIVVLLDEPTS
jgi:ATP-binding cassette, subfamily A (ABC1), member 3